jgi:6-phosphofructokinase
MRRIGILTAGGDTPAPNGTIAGAVVRAHELKAANLGLVKGFKSLFNPRVPHVLLNSLDQEIPEQDPTKGGTLIGSSRNEVDPNDRKGLDVVESRLKKLRQVGLISSGGDGTLETESA